VYGASTSASPRAVIPDLLTDCAIHITASGDRDDNSVDLIDLSDPSLLQRPSAVVSPAKVGSIHAEKCEREIPVHFYAVPE
ncbi:hypothetical protein AAVH_41589, partial [Aphelenchoides avenae]